MDNNDLIKYKNYYGSIQLDPKDNLFYGKIEYFRDLITYEAKYTKTLIKAFQEAVYDYFNDCNTLKQL